MPNPIPDGYTGIIPYLVVKDAKAAIAFYTQAFAGEERFRLDMDDRIGHAELNIGGGVLMLADEFPESGIHAPDGSSQMPISLMIYVTDVDRVVAQSIAAGAKPGRAVEDQFYGDRIGSVIDPFGYEWSLATHIKDVSPEAMQAYLQGGSEQ